ncbi:TPA: hypothetical protein VBA39_001882 [Streptococcus agalactiae]|nr:hypothetical protein [Streptococcus agalactiae]
MDLSQKYLMSISTDGSLGDFTLGNNLSAGSYYIDYNDTSKFRLNMDLTFYYATSNSDGIAYTANRNNYKDLNPNNKSQNGYQSFGRVIVDGFEIGRIVCNNKLIWQKQGRSTSVSGDWNQLWQGNLSLDDVRLPAYRTYLFKSGNDSFTKSANDLIGSYESINGNTLIARYDNSNNQLLISGLGQNPVTIYGQN